MKATYAIRYVDYDTDETIAEIKELSKPPLVPLASTAVFIHPSLEKRWVEKVEYGFIPTSKPVCFSVVVYVSK